MLPPELAAVHTRMTRLLGPLWPVLVVLAASVAVQSLVLLLLAR